MQCGSVRVEVHLVRLGQLACRIHQSRPCNRNHHLVCVRHLFYIRIHHLVCVRHLCNRNRATLVQHSTKNLGQRLAHLGRTQERHGQMPDRLARIQELRRRLDCTMHTEPELGFGKQTGSQQQQINKLVIEVALKILFHSRKNIRRKSLLRRSQLPQNTTVSLFGVIPAGGSC